MLQKRILFVSRAFYGNVWHLVTVNQGAFSKVVSQMNGKKTMCGLPLGGKNEHFVRPLTSDMMDKMCSNCVALCKGDEELTTYFY